MALAVLSGCTSLAQGGPAARLQDVASATPQSVMANVLRGLRKCWFDGSGEYRSLAIADERDSYSNRPRVLLVDRGNPTGRPKLVAESYGPKARLDVYGPLATPRRKAAIRRFGAGGTDCR